MLNGWSGDEPSDSVTRELYT